MSHLSPFLCGATLKEQKTSVKTVISKKKNHTKNYNKLGLGLAFKFQGSFLRDMTILLSNVDGNISILSINSIYATRNHLAFYALA